MVDPFLDFGAGVLAPSTEMGVLLLEFHQVVMPRRLGEAPDPWSIAHGLERLLRRVAARFWWALKSPDPQVRHQRLGGAEYLRKHFELAWAGLHDASDLAGLAHATMDAQRAEIYAGALGAVSGESAGHILADPDLRRLVGWPGKSTSRRRSIRPWTHGLT